MLDTPHSKPWTHKVLAPSQHANWLLGRSWCAEPFRPAMFESANAFWGFQGAAENFALFCPNSHANDARAKTPGPVWQRWSKGWSCPRNISTELQTACLWMSPGNIWLTGPLHQLLAWRQGDPRPSSTGRGIWFWWRNGSHITSFLSSEAESHLSSAAAGSSKCRSATVSSPGCHLSRYC